MILSRIHHSRLDLERLSERCVKFVEKMECKLKEQVWLQRKGKTFAGIITQIVTKSPKKAQKENTEAFYDILLTDGREVEAVPRSALIRSIPTPSKDLMKTFIRANARKFKDDPDMPWVVDEPFMSIHKVKLKGILHFRNS